MELTIKIKMDNAAFGETDSDRVDELRAILTEWLRSNDPLNRGKLLDTNGNKVGTIEISD